MTEIQQNFKCTTMNFSNQKLLFKQAENKHFSAGINLGGGWVDGWVEKLLVLYNLKKFEPLSHSFLCAVKMQNVLPFLVRFNCPDRMQKGK